MYRFEHISFLWLLSIVLSVIFTSAVFYYWKKKAIKRLVDSGHKNILLPRLAPGVKTAKLILLVFALITIVFGLANLQFGSKLEEVKTKGIDLMVALDISNSMKAEDLKPNRLEIAKRGIEQLIKQLHGDRLGIVVFAGDAMVQLPITTDYAAAKLFLNNIETNLLSKQGTAIGTALELAGESFDFESPTQKAILVMTDGENHEDDALKVTDDLNKRGVVIHTIGMGAPQGGPIPIYKGKKQVGFKTDNSGATIISKLDEEMLKNIAVAGSGIYVRASSRNSGVNYVVDALNELEKTEFESKVVRNYQSRFQLFMGIALILLFIRELLPEYKLWSGSNKLFEE